MLLEDVHLWLSQFWGIRDALVAQGGLGQHLLDLTPLDVHGAERVPPQA